MHEFLFKVAEPTDVENTHRNNKREIKNQLFMS